MANNLVRYILIGCVLLARPIFGDNSATGTASSSAGGFGNEGILTSTHQTGPTGAAAQSSSFASNQFLQGLMNTPGLAGLAGNGFGGGMGGGVFPGMAGFAAPPGSEFGGPGGFVGPSYIPYSWLGSLAGFKGDIIFPLLIIGFVLVGIWTAIQFFMGLIVPWVAARTFDGPSAGASFSVAKSGSVSGSSRFLRDLGNAMNPNVPNGAGPAVNMEMLNQIMAYINKGQKTYESSQPAGSSQKQNVTMEATSKPGI